MERKKKIGIVAAKNPEKYLQGNVYHIGRTLVKKYQVDLVGSRQGHHPSMEKLFNFKQYTDIQPHNYIKLLFRDFINIYRYCKYEKPNLLFSVQHPYIGGVVITLIGKYFQIPSVVRYSGHTYTEWKYRDSFSSKILSFLSQWLSDIIFYSNSIITMDLGLAKELTKRGCKNKKINIIPQFTDCSLFYPPADKLQAKKKIGLENQKRIILYVPGGICARKGVETLLKILPKIIKKDPSIFFCIAGASEFGYGEKIKKVGGDNVLLLGGISPQQLADYYRASDILIQLSWYESITRVLLEASASGLYVIARNNEGASEIADATFSTENELIKLLLNNKSKYSLKNKLPSNFRWAFLEKKYLGVFDKWLR